jgi:pimeloyl-ACP methyl ester carboxylesterase
MPVAFRAAFSGDQTVRRQRLGRAARPVLEGLEARALLTGSVAAGAGPGSLPEIRIFHPSEVERARPEHHAPPVHDRGRLHVAIAGSEPSPHSRRVSVPVVRRRVGALSRGANLGDTGLHEYPVLQRLAKFVANPRNPNGGTWVSVKPHSVGQSKSATSADNVYVIAHGWMPGYIGWVDRALDNKRLPLSWQTWQGTNKAYAPSTPWLYQGSSADAFDTGFAINDSGLAEEILKVDPHATVLAYSWIDESATKTTLDLPKDGYHSEAYTTMNGMRMAEAVMQALVPNYSQGAGEVHLIGHSHGARVATVAAVALQQAAAKNTNFNVVGQLTLLDSPEDNGAEFSSVNPLNPINIDAANFDWFYLAQLKIAQPGAPPGAAGDGQNAVRPLFVDSYVSYFGSNFDGFTVNDQDQGINNNLTNVVDVDLNPNPVFSDFDTDRVALEHEYAANWYAGSASTKGTTNQLGLLWSPLISGSSPPPVLKGQKHYGQFTQDWTTVDGDHQFILTQQGPAPAVTPMFTQVTLAEQGEPQGDVTVVGPSSGVTGVTLDDKSKSNTMAIFNGGLDKNDSTVEGFSFSYRFTGGCTDGAQLQILLNGRLYFAMTGSVAKSKVLPGSGQFSATFGLGGEYSALDPQSIQIRLVESVGSAGGTPTTVTVSNFHEFTLGSPRSSRQHETL